MAGGPIFPHSFFPNGNEGRAFPTIYEGIGAGSKFDVGMGVVSSLSGSDAVWSLRFQTPPVLPSGVLKLRLSVIGSFAGQQVAKINPKWMMRAEFEQASAASLTAEGTTTVTLSAGDSGEYRIVKIPLDAATVVADQTLVMNLHFEASGWSIGTTSVWMPSLVWE